MPVVQRALIESPLPKMSAALMKPIDVLRVAELRSPHALGQRVLGPRYRDDMNVIAHETITDDIQAVLSDLLGEQFQIASQLFVSQLSANTARSSISMDLSAGMLMSQAGFHWASPGSVSQGSASMAKS